MRPDLFLDGYRAVIDASWWALGAATPLALTAGLWWTIRRPLDRLRSRLRLAVARRSSPPH